LCESGFRTGKKRSQDERVKDIACETRKVVKGGLSGGDSGIWLRFSVPYEGQGGKWRAGAGTSLGTVGPG